MAEVAEVGGQGAKEGGAAGAGEEPKSRFPIGVQVALLAVLVIALLIAARSMWALADDKDIQAVWDKRMILYEGLFTLASLAIGAAFGVAAYQPQVKKAEQKADDAQKVAERKTEEAALAAGGVEAVAERVRSDILAGVATRSMPAVQVAAPADPQAERVLALEALTRARDFDGPVFVTEPSAATPEPPASLVTVEAVADAIDASR